MIFNSYAFWVFFAIVLVFYRRLQHRGQNLLLLAASYFFYAFWDWRFVSLLLISTVVDYAAARLLAGTEDVRKRRVFLACSMTVNLGMLGFFKYSGFFVAELSHALQQIGFQVSLPLLSLILPAGISFYTFQTMSYVIDVYRRECEATENLYDFALFVSFFPHLVAGPIMRAPNLLAQILQPRQHQPGDFREGLYHVLTGLLKKVVIADNMAPIANTIFRANPGELSGAECLAGVYAFAFQIYGDFSGYSSIAQGVAKWLGFDLIYNFRMPYLATSPSDFWRRWHISLSTWFRDYVYIPLGGNRGSQWQGYRNLLLTTGLSGFWHGAAWTFIVWGLFHGLILCFDKLLTGKPHERPPQTSFTILQRVAGILLTFHLVCFGWLFFRADSLAQAWLLLQQIVTNLHLTHFALTAFAMILFYAGPLMAYELWLEYKRDMLELTRINWLARATAYSYCAFMVWFFPPSENHVFIYFQF